MNNELFRSVYLPYEDMGQDCRYGAIVATKESNGCAVWDTHGENRFSIIKYLHGAAKENEAIELAVKLATDARTAREGA